MSVRRRFSLRGAALVILIALCGLPALAFGSVQPWAEEWLRVFALAALFLVASVSGKLSGIGLAGKVLKWGKGEAWVIGWLLQTKALIMIIFVNILLDKGIITNASFTALLLCAVVSTMLTIPLVSPALKKLEGLLQKSG